MKVGEYARTEYGISKCIKVIPIRKNSFMYEFDKEVYEDVNYLTASELEKYKSSPNIIDLIEAGDYVNGYKVLNVLDFNDNSKMLSLEKIYDNKIANEDIKSVVTKEQFEAMEYKCE